MSISYPDWNLTVYPNALDKSNSNIRQTIINFEDRVQSADPDYHLNYHVLANDVRVLQHAIFSIEEVLGVNPQKTFGTVSARISDLEDYTDIDIRYGGVGWRAIAEEHRPTILSHLHDGSSTGASKINLAKHVSGLLPKANINLVRTENGLTAEDIALNQETDQTIAQKFIDKYDKTGGNISGPVSITGSFNSRIYKEEDAQYCMPSSGATGIKIADANAFSGSAVQGRHNDARGNLISYTSQLRYGDYSLGLRMKVAPTSATPISQMMQPVGIVRIYSGNTLSSQIEIIPSKFITSNEYQMVYLSFTHRGSPNVNVVIEWYGASAVPAIPCNLAVESLVITPMHIAVYDKPNI